jgi:molybdopterin molybdotransferase
LEDITAVFEVRSVEEVMEIIKKNFSDNDIGTEVVDIRDAIGRVTAQSIMAPENIPGFNRSTVDGYAVISSDTFGAGESIPAQLELQQEVRMGKKPPFQLKKGQAAYVPTGGELPENADSVVMIEYTEDYKDGYIYINKSSAPGNHIIFTGDDTCEGDLVIEKGRQLRPQEIGALAAMGYSRISVFKKPRVGIISTGDEIVDINDSTSGGAKVRDINSYSLFAGVSSCNCIPVRYGIINDDFEMLKNAVEKAVEECEVVLVSGGSSVGTRDETLKVIEALGEPGVLVHGIAVKPGKPTIIGKIKCKAVFGLPGHPVSAYMIFRIFVCMLLEVLTKTPASYRNTNTAVMYCNYPSNNGREEFLPVKLSSIDGIVKASPVFGKSGLITSLVSADGFVHIKRGVEGLAKGQVVEIVYF